MKDFNKLIETLTYEERASLSLRALYREAGYKQYVMSKFEEYDLYAKNKDFLVSDNIITFTDTDGRLLALKPDVTLSIIKNGRDAVGVEKLYYNEHVYRVSRGTRSFREIMQVGAECIGEVGKEEITEIILLAKASLDEISTDNILEISELDIVSGVLDALSVEGEVRERIYEYLGQKNVQAIERLVSSESIEGGEIIARLAEISGAPSEVIPALDAFRLNDALDKTVSGFCDILSGLVATGARRVTVDFSLLGDMRYYNGIAIKGFVNGIPTGILSGGQYDGLMKKMKRGARAIGFAVYLDELDKLPLAR